MSRSLVRSCDAPPPADRFFYFSIDGDLLGIKLPVSPHAFRHSGEEIAVTLFKSDPDVRPLTQLWVPCQDMCDARLAPYGLATASSRLLLESYQVGSAAVAVSQTKANLAISRCDTGTVGTLVEVCVDGGNFHPSSLVTFEFESDECLTRTHPFWFRVSPFYSSLRGFQSPVNRVLQR